MMGKTETQKSPFWAMPVLQALANDRQRRFVLEYLQDSCGAQAAIRAGYSRKCARQQASDLLSKPDIEAALDVLRHRLAAQLELSAESVLNELSETVAEARQDHNQGAAISGIKLMGNYLGMWGTADRRQPDDVPVEEAVIVEEDEREDNQILRDFAGDVRMLASQRQALGGTVEDFLDDIEDMVTNSALGHSKMVEEGVSTESPALLSPGGTSVDSVGALPS